MYRLKYVDEAPIRAVITYEYTFLLYFFHLIISITRRYLYHIILNKHMYYRFCNENSQKNILLFLLN